MAAEVKPSRIAFNQVVKGSEPTIEFTVHIREPEKVRVTTVTVDDERLTVSPGEGGTYELRLSDTSELGRLRGKVTVNLEGADVPSIQVPLSGEVVGDLSYPKAFSLYRRGGVIKPQRVTVSSRSGKTVSVTEVKDELNMLKADLTQGDKGEALIELAVKDDTEAHDAPVRGKLLVKTTDPDEPELTIPYTIQYQEHGGRQPGKSLGKTRPQLRKLK